jgi:hypothetical protein
MILSLRLMAAFLPNAGSPQFQQQLTAKRPTRCATLSLRQIEMDVSCVVLRISLFSGY